MSSRTQPPTVNLKERIAALNQRTVSGSSIPNRSLSPNPGQPSSTIINTGSANALRDKIAKFEKKGAVPTPKGSFSSGLGAPPGPARRGELYGNRIQSLPTPRMASHNMSRSNSPIPGLPSRPSSPDDRARSPFIGDMPEVDAALVPLPPASPDLSRTPYSTDNVRASTPKSNFAAALEVARRTASSSEAFSKYGSRDPALLNKSEPFSSRKNSATEEAPVEEAGLLPDVASETEDTTEMLLDSVQVTEPLLKESLAIVSAHGPTETIHTANLVPEPEQLAEETVEEDQATEALEQPGDVEQLQATEQVDQLEIAEPAKEDEQVKEFEQVKVSPEEVVQDSVEPVDDPTTPTQNVSLSLPTLITSPVNDQPFQAKVTPPELQLPPNDTDTLDNLPRQTPFGLSPQTPFASALTHISSSSSTSSSADNLSFEYLTYLNSPSSALRTQDVFDTDSPARAPLSGNSLADSIASSEYDIDSYYINGVQSPGEAPNPVADDDLIIPEVAAPPEISVTTPPSDAVAPREKGSRANAAGLSVTVQPPSRVYSHEEPSQSSLSQVLSADDSVDESNGRPLATPPSAVSSFLDTPLSQRRSGRPVSMIETPSKIVVAQRVSTATSRGHPVFVPASAVSRQGPDEMSPQDYGSVIVHRKQSQSISHPRGITSPEYDLDEVANRPPTFSATVHRKITEVPASAPLPRLPRTPQVVRVHPATKIEPQSPGFGDLAMLMQEAAILERRLLEGEGDGRDIVYEEPQQAYAAPVEPATPVSASTMSDWGVSPVVPAPVPEARPRLSKSSSKRSFKNPLGRSKSTHRDTEYEHPREAPHPATHARPPIPGNSREKTFRRSSIASVRSLFVQHSTNNHNFDVGPPPSHELPPVPMRRPSPNPTMPIAEEESGSHIVVGGKIYSDDIPPTPPPKTGYFSSLRKLAGGSSRSSSSHMPGAYQPSTSEDSERASTYDILPPDHSSVNHSPRNTSGSESRRAGYASGSAVGWPSTKKNSNNNGGVGRATSFAGKIWHRARTVSGASTLASDKSDVEPLPSRNIDTTPHSRLSAAPPSLYYPDSPQQSLHPGSSASSSRPESWFSLASGTSSAPISPLLDKELFDAFPSPPSTSGHGHAPFIASPTSGLAREPVIGEAEVLDSYPTDSSRYQSQSLGLSNKRRPSTYYGS